MLRHQGILHHFSDCPSGQGVCVVLQGPRVRILEESAFYPLVPYRMDDLETELGLRIWDIKAFATSAEREENPVFEELHYADTPLRDLTIKLTFAVVAPRWC